LLVDLGEHGGGLGFDCRVELGRGRDGVLTEGGDKVCLKGGGVLSGVCVGPELVLVQQRTQDVGRLAQGLSRVGLRGPLHLVQKLVLVGVGAEGPLLQGLQQLVVREGLHLVCVLTYHLALALEQGVRVGVRLALHGVRLLSLHLQILRVLDWLSLLVLLVLLGLLQQHVILQLVHSESLTPSDSTLVLRLRVLAHVFLTSKLVLTLHYVLISIHSKAWELALVLHTANSLS